MKIIGTFALVVTASIALSQPAEGRPRGGGGHSFSSGRHFSAPSARFSSRPRSFSRGARFHSPSTRYYSQAAFRNRVYTPTHSSRRFSSQTVAGRNRYAANSDSSRVAARRMTAQRSQGFNDNSRIVARHSANQHPNWDRRREYNWRGHRCRWYNNSWVIFGLYPAFYPWGYGYGYPYSYYYDDRYYDDGYAASEYSEYDNSNADSMVSQVQAALAREGYYHGAIDGSIGPATRNALRRYQRNRGLDATGRIDQPVIEALGLG